MRRGFRLLVIGTLVLVPAVVALASADMSASPSSVTFPEQCTHTSASAKPVAVTNNGPDDATDVTVSVVPSTMSSVFQLGGQTGASQLGPGSQLQVQVGFVPQHVGVNSATAVVTFTEPGVTPSPSDTHRGGGGPPPTPEPTTGTLQIPLAGSAIDRWIDVNPPGVNFGSLHTGKTAPPRTITIFDDGDSPLTITSMFLGGRQPGDFIVGTLSRSVVSDGHPVTVTLGFKPKAAGARAAKLMINSNSCSGTFTVQLGGIAVEQDITAAPKTLDFANIEVGATPAPVKQIAIVNQGGAPLTVKSIQMVADDPTTTDLASFTLTGVPKVLPRKLIPGEPLNLKVAFNPADTTPRKVNIKVTSDDPDTKVLTIPVTALAVAKPTPTPSETAVAPPPKSGGGFHLHLGAYIPTVIVAAMVAGFFAVLIVTRRRRGIPE